MSLSAKARHEWFQTDSTITITIFVKAPPDGSKLSDNDVDIDFQSKKLIASVALAGGSSYCLDFDLFDSIAVDQSCFKVLGNKVEIKLKKLQPGSWKSLEVQKSAGSATTAAYPTSSKKGQVNWDALAKQEVTEDLDKDNPNAFFQQLYAGADEDTRRAMMKSFIESQGTVLSTNWKEVGSKKVDIAKSSQEDDD